MYAQEEAIKLGGALVNWEKPSYIDFRFGFEVTMYINNR
mgnify:FL=1|jgi:coenzyme PQQ precursor peptide PqqA